MAPKPGRLLLFDNMRLGTSPSCDTRTVHEGALVESGVKIALLVWFHFRPRPFGPNAMAHTDGWGRPDVVVCDHTAR